jgi:hypothetical protein
MTRPRLAFLKSPRFWQRCAFTAAGLATLIAAFYLIEDYRGERAWSEYAAGARARGVKLTFEEFIRRAFQTKRTSRRTTSFGNSTQPIPRCENAPFSHCRSRSFN